MKYNQNKRRIDPRYFLSETAVATEGRFKDQDIDDSEQGKRVYADPREEETADEKDESVTGAETLEEEESHEDHPGRSCDKAHPAQTHQGWLHLELMEDIDTMLEEDPIGPGQRLKAAGEEAVSAGKVGLGAGGVYQALQALQALASASGSTMEAIISRMDPAMVDLIKQAGTAVAQASGMMEEINGHEALPNRDDEEKEADPKEDEEDAFSFGLSGKSFRKQRRDATNRRNLAKKGLPGGR